MRTSHQDSIWIRCPCCENKTRAKVYENTVLINFPLFCPKCKKEYIISVAKMEIEQLDQLNYIHDIMGTEFIYRETNGIQELVLVLEFPSDELFGDNK